jgi:hypothetical protein
MPLLAWEKRKLARRTANKALAADAVQSATCAISPFSRASLRAAYNMPAYDLGTKKNQFTFAIDAIIRY